MNRRAFVSRMAFAAVCSGLLGSELLDRAPRVEERWASMLDNTVRPEHLNFPKIPTSDPHIEGRGWNDNGRFRFSAG